MTVRREGCDAKSDILYKFLYSVNMYILSYCTNLFIQKKLFYTEKIRRLPQENYTNTKKGDLTF
jgi:hypothetical protein